MLNQKSFSLLLSPQNVQANKRQIFEIMVVIAYHKLENNASRKNIDTNK